MALKVAVIIAGGSGLGAAAAIQLANDGYKVAILSSSGKGEKLAKELGGIGLTGSNQSNDDIAQLVDKVLQRWGRVDVLVNSGAHGPRGHILELTDEQWHTGMDVYLMNVIRPVRIVAPIMEKQKSGSIINFSSIAAIEPILGFPASAVFRAGLSAYTKIFAQTYASSNVRMNNILCGWIDSLPISDERLNEIPMQRYGKTQEITSTIAFLASDNAAYITGQNLRVDGGLSKSI
ncbi:SDR family oxidoreductase [Providencia sp. wls1922]|uniref:SDR family oxidoreductase n=1 Tax=unclassified Providencia TaxID=2633465 RepID=UPI0012B67D1C|nr:MULTISPECIES: SDR family oxidoreductase [unclassified Providencia]MTB45100.1 SDR family oxidoreductase [Providencia sp. wls1950]MTC45891.1 SDR family oxidoreductase [Providencia sp. wls1922]